MLAITVIKKNIVAATAFW